MNESSLEDQDPTLDLSAADSLQRQEPALSGIISEDDPKDQPSQDPKDIPESIVDEHGKEIH